jgi:hypothetical protein
MRTGSARRSGLGLQAPVLQRSATSFRWVALIDFARRTIVFTHLRQNNYYFLSLTSP